MIASQGELVLTGMELNPGGGISAGQIGGQPSVPGTQQTFVISAQGLLTKYPNLKVIVAPTTVGIEVWK